MPTKKATKRRRRSQDVSREKQLSRTPTATLLWAADHELFTEFVGRKRTTPANLLREIVHEWALTIRVSGQARDTIELAGPVRKLHQQILSEQLTPVNSALSTIVDLLKAASNPALSANADTAIVPSVHQDSAMLTLLQRLAEELKATKEELEQLRNLSDAHYTELERLRAFAIANYMLSGQSFGATWAALDFIQRYIAEPMLRSDPTHNKNSVQASITFRDDARLEGLQMVAQMSLEFHYPEEYQLVLITPPEDQP